MWHHAQYLSGEGAERGGICYSGARWALGGENIARFMCFLISIIAIFYSLCHSVKLFSSQPSSFAFYFRFSSPSHRGGGRSERVTAWFFANWGQTITTFSPQFYLNFSFICILLLLIILLNWDDNAEGSQHYFVDLLNYIPKIDYYIGSLLKFWFPYCA